MEWRQEIDAKLADLRGQLPDVDPDLSPAMVRMLNSRIAELETQRARPVPEDICAQICLSLDHVIDHAGTLRTFVLHTGPVGAEHAAQAVEGLYHHLDRIHVAMSTTPEPVPEQKEGIA